MASPASFTSDDAAALAELLGATAHTSFETVDGRGDGVGVELTFDERDQPARARLVAYNNGDVFWTELSTRRQSPQGIYSRICELTPRFFRDRGFKRYVASPANEVAESILMRRLAWKREKDSSLIVHRLGR